MTYMQSNISEPFDPSTIDVEKKNMSVTSLISMLENGVIDLAPAYQREANLWPPIKQSQLIESLLLKLPLPSMYFEYDKGRRKYVVVDGLQRLCAIQRFAVDKVLKLTGLEVLEDVYGGLGYEDLSFQDRLELGLEEITVNILKAGTPDMAKFIIFKRLNSGGTDLVPQEICNALYPGAGLDLLNAISELPVFKSIGFKHKRMKDREVILRSLAFMKYGDQYSGRMESFLTESQKKLNALPEEELHKLSQKLQSSLLRNNLLFGDKAFRKDKSKNREPSASLFDVLTVEMSRLDSASFERLLSHKDDFTKGLEKLLMSDDEFKDSVGNKSDRRYATEYRYKMIRCLIDRFSV